MKTSHAAKRQGDFLFAEARASPTPHIHVEHLRSRRPGPACRHFVQALAALQFSAVHARIVPSDDYDDLPDLIDIAAAVTGLIGFRVAQATANGNRWTPLLEQLS